MNHKLPPNEAVSPISWVLLSPRGLIEWLQNTFSYSWNWWKISRLHEQLGDGVKEREDIPKMEFCQSVSVRGTDSDLRSCQHPGIYPWWQCVARSVPIPFSPPWKHSLVGLVGTLRTNFWALRPWSIPCLWHWQWWRRVQRFLCNLRDEAGLCGRKWLLCKPCHLWGWGKALWLFNLAPLICNCW